MKTKLFYLLILILLSCNLNGKKLPNIVMVFTDDQGYSDVGVFGAKGFLTPNLDQMAQNGMKS